MNRLIHPLLIVACCLTGCASKPDMPTANDLLAGAHQSLVVEDYDRAAQWLGSAHSRLETVEEKRTYALLVAELDIRSDRADVAAREMTELLADVPDDPRANELAGKARLLEGGYAEASKHFTLCIERYEDEVDVDRAIDLLALSRGFEQYAGGHFAAAHEEWGAIRDPDLRGSVLDATQLASR